MSIEDWRLKIDAIDSELLGLLNQRASLAVKVGQSKRLTGIELYDPAREEEVIERVRKQDPGPLDEQAIVELFSCVIREYGRIEAWAWSLGRSEFSGSYCDFADQLPGIDDAISETARSLTKSRNPISQPAANTESLFRGSAAPSAKRLRSSSSAKTLSSCRALPSSRSSWPSMKPPPTTYWPRLKTVWPARFSGRTIFCWKVRCTSRPKLLSRSNTISSVVRAPFRWNQECRVPSGCSSPM